MPGPNYGALGMTFTVVRGMQAISLISVIGMTANFIAQMVSANTAPPNVLIGTLSVVSTLHPHEHPDTNMLQVVIAVLYCVITYILYFDSILPFLISTGMDTAFLIALIVVACLVGKPLSYLNCAALNQDGGNIDAFLQSIASNLGSVSYYTWAGANATVCYESKAIWGLSIALCILFAVSSIITAVLWKSQRGANAAGAKSVV